MDSVVDVYPPATEILPRHASIADKFSLVRSVYHTGAAVHDTGHQMMQTGRLFSGGINTPHAGCALSYLRGRKTDLPAHAILPEPMGSTGGNLPHGQDAGFLGKAFDPFVLNADPSKAGFKVPDLLPPAEIGEARLNRRRKLRDVVEDTVKGFENSENAELLGSNFEAAFRLMTSPAAREAFDLSKEPEKVRQRYGVNRFGQCCLLSRRLIEAGVRFVTVNTFLTVFNEITWDIHGSNPFTSIAGMKDIVAPMYDQAYSALIEDLEQRGLLENTLVCNLAEFGRTPRVNPAGGRDHWPQCYSVYFAGGGVKGGQVVGASDPNGGFPAERAVDPANVVGTIYHSLGFDLDTYTDDRTLHLNSYELNKSYEWHNDSTKRPNNDIKLTGLINLSTEDYEGGEFQLNEGKEQTIEQFSKGGDMIMFKSHILHRVLPVRKGIRKSLAIFLIGPNFK